MLRRCGGVLLVLATAGCGYFQSGTWEDDPKNWERAFGSKKPDGAEVLRSRFTRYPHFTYEATFYFQMRLSDALERQLLEKRFERLEGARALGAKEAVYSDAPTWFAPGKPERYNAWMLVDPQGVSGVVLRDRQTSDLFIFFSQL
jgi:hypothetical protein